jgi:hypothetical protein
MSPNTSVVGGRQLGLDIPWCAPLGVIRYIMSPHRLCRMKGVILHELGEAWQGKRGA